MSLFLWLYLLFIWNRTMLSGLDFSFGKEQRLLTAIMFKSVFNQTSFKVHQPNLLFFIKTNQDSSVSRLGLAITKKRVKRANERNRIKRLAREYFRLNQGKFSMPLDVVLTVKQTTKPLSNAEITNQIDAAFQQINYKISKQVSHNHLYVSNS